MSNQALHFHVLNFGPGFQWHLIVMWACECWGCSDGCVEWGLHCDWAEKWSMFELGSFGGERSWGEEDMGQEEIIITLFHINRISSQAPFCPSFLHSAELSYFLTVKRFSRVFISLPNNYSSVVAWFDFLCGRCCLGFILVCNLGFIPSGLSPRLWSVQRLGSVAQDVSSPTSPHDTA